ncbi:hypothetical protein [Thiothrix winogradskyi]|uniref:Lipoprotein n=1 Tax=Thiothrix winogradskyi TaxID=96472 RepID=A0ABY3STL8_9GAMM|nr:hypothetical protein [Thiothrix winogradskyi]UJS22867.1 hypothetical protein L2Y54_13045 [Thiothrix winogradskyi]
MKSMKTLLCAALFAASLQGCVTLAAPELKQDEKIQVPAVAYQEDVVEQTPEQVSTEVLVEVMRDVLVPIITALIARG